MTGKNGIPYRNAEGYPDPTAYEALSAAMAEYQAEQEMQHRHPDEGDVRTQHLIKAIKSIVELAGYDLMARIEVKDRRTGRVYR